MSLLMDALKKAEREKNRALTRKNSEDVSASDDQSSISGHISDQDVSAHQNEATSEEPSTTEPDQKDENWAFDTGELELEPLAQKAELADDENNPSASLDDDITLREPMPSQAEMDKAASSGESDLTIKSDSDSDKPGFDHDATLPSERAIQSSLKDYFEASQSITMDQSSVNAAVTPEVTEHSVTSTSPLDVSATHVSAHTIFTASQARKASTGLARYALFGTLFLAAGLGATALYYSFVTPKAIDMPTTLPTVATMVESNEHPQKVEVDVTTAEAVLPIDPVVMISADREAPVQAEAVENESSVKPSNERPEMKQTLVDAPAEFKTETTPVEKDRAASIVDQKSELELDVEQVVIKAPEVKKQPERVEEKQVETLASTSFDQATPDSKVEHEVVNFSQLANTPKPEPEEAIIRKDELYQTAVIEGGYTLNNPVSSSTQPIDVMSANDFSEGLTMPRSAIRITKGQTHRASNSDLTMAYQAYQAGDFLTAKSMYRKILNRRVDSRDARLGIAAIAVMEGNYETANRHYQYLLQQNPKDQVVNAALFNLQGNSGGRVNEAQLKLSLDQNPDSPQIHFSLGSFYAKQSRWPEAQQAFFDAYSIDKGNADYAYNLAVSLDQMGQAKAALSHYRTALKLADKTTVSFNTSRVLARIQKLSGIVKH